MHDKLNIKFEKIYSPLRVPDLRVDPSMQKAKGSKVKNIACVKCYKSVSYTHLTLPTKRIV